MMTKPGLDLPFWVPLTCVTLAAAMPAFLDRQGRGFFIGSSVAGSWVGILLGCVVGPPIDKAVVAIPLLVTFGAVVTAIVAVPSAFVASRLSVSHFVIRRTAWVALLTAAAVGPFSLVIAPPLAARRIARNEQSAADTFVALQRAVERTLVGNSDRSEICDGSALARNYSGAGIHGRGLAAHYRELCEERWLSLHDLLPGKERVFD
jgi:hypothetical protein